MDGQYPSHPVQMRIGSFNKTGSGTSYTPEQGMEEEEEGLQIVGKVEWKRAKFEGLMASEQEQLKQDLAVLTAFIHENFVRCVSAFIDHPSSTVVVVTECAVGLPLSFYSRFHRESGFTSGDCITTSVSNLKGMLKQVLASLDYLHERFIIHNDLRRDDIMVISSRKVVLGHWDPFARLRMALVSDDIKAFGICLLGAWFGYHLVADQIKYHIDLIRDEHLKSLTSSCFTHGRPSARKILAHTWWDDSGTSLEQASSTGSYDQEFCMDEVKKFEDAYISLLKIKQHHWRSLASKRQIHDDLKLVCRLIGLLLPDIWGSEDAMLLDQNAIQKLQELSLVDIRRRLDPVNLYAVHDCVVRHPQVFSDIDKERFIGNWQTQFASPLARWVETCVENLRTVNLSIVDTEDEWFSNVAAHSTEQSTIIYPNVSGQEASSHRYDNPFCNDEQHDFVNQMRENGFRNWIVHNGKTLNLSDPNDLEGLSEFELNQLIELAATTTTRDQHHGSPIVQRAIPLQPWEAEKIQSMAAQIIQAIQDGRYVKDFGDMLMGQLRQWGEGGDAEAWVKREEAWVASLVDADDANSRKELLKWLEDSLVTTLREVQKDVDRGFVSGAAGYPRSQASSSIVVDIHQSNDTSRSIAQCNGDEKEQAALHQALAESLMEFADPDDSDFDQEHSETSDGETHIPITSSKPINGNQCHPCGLSHGCCHCNHRIPRKGLLPALVVWWRKRGLEQESMPSGHFRFYCNTCLQRRPVNGCEIPLPFGGCLLQEECDADGWEVVVPHACLDYLSETDTCSEMSWTDVAGDTLWVVVDHTGDFGASK